MDRKKYMAIVFDLGNVLIPFNYGIMLNKLDALKEGLGKKFWEFYKSHYSMHRSLERGEIKDEDFIEIMLDKCDRTLDKITFCRYYSEIFAINENVVSLLPKLKKNDYKLFLLSNTNEIHREYGYKNYDFLNLFDKLFLSHRIGAVKPEPEIYKTVEKYSGFLPEEHLFIDDIPEYAEGAKKVGWDAINFENYDQLIKEFNDRGILI